MRTLTVRYERLRLAIRSRMAFFDCPPSEGDEEGQKRRDRALAEIEGLTEEPIPIPGEDALVWLHKLRVSAYRLRRWDGDDPITPENKADRKVLTNALATLRALLPPAGPVDPVGPIRGETIPHDAIREHVETTIIPWLLGCLNYNRKDIDAEQIQAQLKPIQLEGWLGIITTHLENEGFLIRLESPPLPAVGTFHGYLAARIIPYVPPQRWTITPKVLSYVQQRTRDGQTPNLASPPAERQDSTTTDKRQAEVGQARSEKPEGGGDSSGGRARKKDVDARILAMLQKDADSAKWSAKRWANWLGCAKSSVAESDGWKAVMKLRKQSKIESALNSQRGDSHDDLRKAKRNRVDGIL